MILIAGTLLGLGSLAALTTGAAAMNSRGRRNSSGVSELGPQRILRAGWDLATTRLDGSNAQATTIEGRLEQLERSGPNRFISKLKVGHLGLFALVLTPLWKVLEYFGLDSDHWAVKAAKVAIVPEALFALTTAGVATFGTNTYEKAMENAFRGRLSSSLVVTPDGKIMDETGTHLAEESMGFDSGLILPEKAREKATVLAKRAIHNCGIVVNATGPTGTGKSSLSRAIALVMAKEAGKNCRIWQLAEDCFNGTMADSDSLSGLARIIDIFGSAVGIDRLAGNTITEIIEQVVAEAEVHYRTTGEPVQVLLDEAQKIFEKARAKATTDAERKNIDLAEMDWLSAVQYMALRQQHVANEGENLSPHTRSKLEREFGQLATKITTPMCKGVALIITSNCSSQDITYHLIRRLESITFFKPAELERKLKVEATINKFFEKNPNAIKNITADNLINALTADDTVYKIGNVNLLRAYFDPDITIARQKAARAGFSPLQIDSMEARDVLHFQDIERAVIYALENYQPGQGTDFLVNKIKENLRGYVKDQLANKDITLGEVKMYTEAAAMTDDELIDLQGRESTPKPKPKTRSVTPDQHRDETLQSLNDLHKQLNDPATPDASKNDISQRIKMILDEVGKEAVETAAAAQEKSGSDEGLGGPLLMTFKAGDDGAIRPDVGYSPDVDAFVVAARKLGPALLGLSWEEIQAQIRGKGGFSALSPEPPKPASPAPGASPAGGAAPPASPPVPSSTPAQPPAWQVAVMTLAGVIQQNQEQQARLALALIEQENLKTELLRQQLEKHKGGGDWFGNMTGGTGQG